jgi:hypothetical protein
MRSLTVSEKRTLRWAAAGLAIYLGLFYGVGGGRNLEIRRADYQQLLGQVRNISNELRPYENKILLIEKLRAQFRIQPGELSRASVVGEVSAVIQAAAQTGGVQLGPIRESPGSAAARELASMMIEGTGPVPAVLQFIHRVEALGYPLIIESIQITSAPGMPGQVALLLQIVVLDYDRWKPEPGRNHA